MPWNNSSTELPSELPAQLLFAPLVWVRRGVLVPPLQSLYDGPYAVLRCGPRSFTIRVGSRDEVVAVSCLKACTAADAMPGSLRRCGRPTGSRPGGLAATKRVSFSDLLVSSPSWRRFLHAGTGGAITGATDAVPVPSTGTVTEVGPLTSSPPSRGQSSGEALWTPAYTPADRLTSWGVLYHPCTVPVYKLLCVRVCRCVCGT